MFTRCFSVALCSVVLVAVFVFTVPSLSLPLLFARGTESGDLCWQGQFVDSSPSPTTSPDKATNPPSYVETRKKRLEFTDGMCELDATCIPIDWTCTLFLSSPPNFRVYEWTETQEFVRRPDGGYNPRPANTTPIAMDGLFYNCVQSP